MDGGSANTGLMQIGFLVLFIAVMYLMLIRPQKKKERAINEMRSSVQVGDEIITIGGICGQVVKTRGENLTIQVGSDKVRFEIMRWGVSKIVDSSARPSGSKKSRPTDEDDEPEARRSLPKKMKRADEEGPEEDGDDRQ